MATQTALSGFTPADFAVFTIEGFAPRMAALKEQIRPKLTEIGDELTPVISKLLGQPMYAHVARHARRTVNPPADTWVAFSPSARGYKAHPHFQVGIWGSHLFVRFATIYESPNKAVVARNLLANPDFASSLPAGYVWSWDHCEPESATYEKLTDKGWRHGLERAIKVQKAEVLCGIDVPKSHKLAADGPKLLKKITETVKTLRPLYHMAQSAP